MDLRVLCVAVLASQFSVSMVHSKECQSLDIFDMTAEPEFLAARDQAWIDSAEGTPGEHEEGFSVYHCRTIKRDECPNQYDYTTEIDRYPMGTRDSIDGVPERTDPNCRLVIDFHTHPGVGQFSPFSNDDFANNFTSDTDEQFADERMVYTVIAWGLGTDPATSRLFAYRPDSIRTPNWECSETPPPNPACNTDTPAEGSEGASGSSFGDPHLITFDGYYYSFQAVGEFVLAQSQDEEIVVQSRQIPWDNSRTIALNSAVAVNIGGDIVELYGLAFDTPTLMINKSIVLPDSVDAIPLPNGGTVERALNEYEFIWPDGSKVMAKVVTGILTITVNVSDRYSGEMQGLLGNFDGTRDNEIIVRGETDPPDSLNYTILHNDYANSWRVSEATTLFSYQEGETTETFTDRTFPEQVVRPESFPQSAQNDAEQVCRGAGVTDPLMLDACMIDVLSTGETDFAETAAEVQQNLQTALVTSDLTDPSPVTQDCPCADTFNAFAMDIPPWDISYLNMRTAPGAGCSLSNNESFLDNETLLLNGRSDSQTCTASVGSSNLDQFDVSMTDEQYNACLDIIEQNAQQWFANGHTLEISRNFEGPVAVTSVDEISCLR